MKTHEFTPAQIEQGIAWALEERNFEVIPGLVKLLGIQDPKRAGEVLEELQGRVTLTFDLRQGGGVNA